MVPMDSPAQILHIYAQLAMLKGPSEALSLVYPGETAEKSNFSTERLHKSSLAPTGEEWWW